MGEGEAVVQCYAASRSSRMETTARSCRVELFGEEEKKKRKNNNIYIIYIFFMADITHLSSPVFFPRIPAIR